MNFQCRARSVAGISSSGVLEAESTSAARQMLRDQGLFALSLEPRQQRKGDFEQSTAVAASRWNSRVTKHDLLMLTSQLVIMTRSGVELAEAFKVAHQQCVKPSLRNTLGQIYDDLSNGISISVA